MSSEPRLLSSAGAAALRAEQVGLDVDGEQLVEGLSPAPRPGCPSGRRRSRTCPRWRRRCPAGRSASSASSTARALSAAVVTSPTTPAVAVPVGGLDRGHPVGGPVERDHPGALGDEAVDQRAAEPRSRAGHDRHVVLEPAHRRPPDSSCGQVGRPRRPLGAGRQAERERRRLADRRRGVQRGRASPPVRRRPRGQVAPAAAASAPPRRPTAARSTAADQPGRLRRLVGQHRRGDGDQ